MTSTSPGTRVTQWVLLAVGPVVFVAGAWWLAWSGYQADLPGSDPSTRDVYSPWALFFVGGLALAVSVLMWFRRHTQHWLEELAAGYTIAILFGVSVAYLVLPRLS